MKPLKETPLRVVSFQSNPYLRSSVCTSFAVRFFTVVLENSFPFSALTEERSAQLIVRGLHRAKYNQDPFYNLPKVDRLQCGKQTNVTARTQFKHIENPARTQSSPLTRNQNTQNPQFLGPRKIKRRSFLP